MSTSEYLPSESFPASVFEFAELGGLFERHGPRLTAILRRRIDPALGARLDAEDIVNAAFLAARRRWPAYRADRRVSEFVWLYRIVNDTFVEEWRKATASNRDVYRGANWDERGSVDLCLRLVEKGAGPATEAVRRERTTFMERAVAGLPDGDREVIRLRGYEDLSYAEIAEHLGVEESAATKRYVRALRKLKEIWQRITGESRP